MKLEEILKIRGIDPEKTKVVRHPYRNKRVKAVYDKGYLYEYTKNQVKDVFKNSKYVAVFLGTSGTLSEFYSCYEIKGIEENVDYEPVIPEDYPLDFEEGETINFYYELEECKELIDLKQRLVIDWGQATISWCQNGTTTKEVFMIKQNNVIKNAPDFESFEDTRLTFNQLDEIISNPLVYNDWHSVLQSINAIYMILDTKSGKQYVGTTYGIDGLLGRWSEYVNSFTGGNVALKDLLLESPNAYKNFEYSILRVLPKSITSSEAIKYENLYKEKFHTRKFGLNKN